MKLDFSFMSEYYIYFVKGTEMTLLLALTTVLIGTLLGTFICLIRLSNNKIVRFIGATYVEIIRGTPVLVQLFIFYYGISQFVNVKEFPAAVIALGLNSAAYVAEIIRAGIQAVDKGQMEAARSLGMTKSMTMMHIIIPQAFKNILPALGNEFVTIIKESSVISVIGLSELTRASDIVRTGCYKSFEPLLVVAAIYFVLTFTLSKVMGIGERRMRNSD